MAAQTNLVTRAMIPTYLYMCCAIGAHQPIRVGRPRSGRRGKGPIGRWAYGGDQQTEDARRQEGQGRGGARWSRPPCIVPFSNAHATLLVSEPCPAVPPLPATLPMPISSSL